MLQTDQIALLLFRWVRGHGRRRRIRLCHGVRAGHGVGV